MYRRIRNQLYLNIYNKPYWSLKDFTVKRTLRNDMWNGLENSQVHYDLYDTNGKCVGCSSIRLATGQMCSTRLDEEYRGCKIGYELIKLATYDKIIYDNTTELWAVTTPNHPFWSKLPNARWCKPAGPNVIGSGFKFDLFAD